MPNELLAYSFELESPAPIVTATRVLGTQQQKLQLYWPHLFANGPNDHNLKL